MHPPGGKPPFDLQKELDQVIGKYEPSPGERAWRRYGRLMGRILATASLAVAAAALVLWVLDSHIREARNAPAPKKPVMIDIRPSPK